MDRSPDEDLVEGASVSIHSSSEHEAEAAEPPESKDEMTEMENVVFVTHKEGDNEPKIGMMFSNENEAYYFYNNYARLKGFSVRRGQYRRLANGTIRKRLFVCSKEGTSRKRNPERVETRTGCPAMIMFTIEKDAWILTQFICEHNHDMAAPNKHEMLRSQRRLTDPLADPVKIKDDASIHPSDLSSNYVEETRGAQNVGSLDLVKQRMKTFEAEDAQGVINHFRHMQADDPSFFYTVQVDSENRLTNCFWRDGRSKVDYKYFSDVVVFDTTYRTSKYNMFCVPFLGVNHHRQNVLFGCAFLLTETIESFIWLFESFLEAMGKHQPRTIFTDQCQAIANAIEKVFPESHHRLCLWNIIQNCAKHIGHHYGKSEFKTHFNHCIHDCETEQEFEEKWGQLLREYDLSENRWLQELYKLRAKWCPVFNQDFFSAGIKSTQRSESMNSVFQDLTSRTMSLSKFVVQYEYVAERMRQEELVEDLLCNHGEPPSVGKVSGLAKQAAIVYTHSNFQIFYEELCECLSVAIEEINNDGIIYTYKLVKDGDKKESFVKFNASNCMVECSCMKFESIGLLCHHSLRVYTAKNIFQIPSIYILKRWTKWAKDGLVMEDNEKEIVEKAKKPISLRMSQLMHKAVQFATKGALTDKITKMADEILDHGLATLENALKELKVEDALVEKEIDTDNEDGIDDKDPLPSSSSQIPASSLRWFGLKGSTNAGLKSQVEEYKKNKTQVEDPSNNASTSRPPRSKKLAQGKNSRSNGPNLSNTLQKPATISDQSFPPAMVVDTHNISQFELQACVTSSMPLGMRYVPMGPLKEGSFPSRAGHHSLQDNQTAPACTEVDLNNQLPHFSQGSFPSIMGHRSSQDTQTPRACNEANLSNPPQFNQESSSSWTFGRPRLQSDASFSGQITPSSQESSRQSLNQLRQTKP